MFDRENLGVIPVDDLKSVFNSFNNILTDTEVNDLLMKADMNYDGDIDYVRFCKLLLQRD
jgi:Ca2+-binding EF-hand superfamily protein